MKLTGLLVLCATSALAQTLHLDKAPLLDAPGPGYRGEPHILESVKPVNEPPVTRWALYPSNALPAGKRVSVAEAAKLETGAYDSPPLYLTGDFIVRATASDRAVLRDAREPGLARIVVIYPPEIPVPVEGAKFSRDGSHPFEIRNVQRTGDGVVTIFVRDVILPASVQNSRPTVAPFTGMLLTKRSLHTMATTSPISACSKLLKYKTTHRSVSS